jgi:hypothetical protein
MKTTSAHHRAPGGRQHPVSMRFDEAIRKRQTRAGMGAARKECPAATCDGRPTHGKHEQTKKENFYRLVEFEHCKFDASQCSS